MALKYEPSLNVKAAPSARSVLAEKQKRSKSPERYRGVQKPRISRVVDQKERQKQLHAAYGNQKVIIPRQSKAALSREERAKKSRDSERQRIFADLHVRRKKLRKI